MPGLIIIGTSAGACLASHSAAKDWFYLPHTTAPRAGLTAHFGGFRNIGTEFAQAFANRDPAGVTPGPLPDPIAFAEHHAGPLPSDAFRTGGPSIAFFPARTPPDDGRSLARLRRGDDSAIGLLCIRNLSALLFHLEAGLRLAYCAPATATEATEVQATAASIQNDANGAADPRYSGATVEIQAMTPAQLRRAAGPILVSVDGGRRARLKQWRLDSSALRFAYDLEAISDDDDGAYGLSEIRTPGLTRHLPRRFPSGEFYCLVAADALYLLHEMENDSGRLLVITIRDAEAVREARAAFALVPALLASHIRSSSANRIALSEIYFRNQSLQLSDYGAAERPDEFFEIASDSADAFARLAWQGDPSPVSGAGSGPVFTGQVFLFSHSTRIIERSDRFRFSRSLRYRAGAQAAPGEYQVDRLAGGPTPRRSYETATARADPTETSPPGATADPTDVHRVLLPGSLCRADLPAYRAICANPGIAPGLAFALRAALQRESDSADAIQEPACTPGDFALTEYNPAGIFVPGENGDANNDGGLKADGKFVELRTKRSCRSDAIFFRVGDTILDPGGSMLQKERALLFVAARDPRRYLALDTEAGPPPIIFSAPALSSAAATDEIVVHALAAYTTDDSRPDDQTIATVPLRRLTGAPIFWTGVPGGTRRPPGSLPAPPFRAVHSLQFAAADASSPMAGSPDESVEGQAAFAGFARGPGRGLRPDLREENAMSPGRLPAQDLSGLDAAGRTASFGPRTSTSSPLSILSRGAPRRYFDVQISEILPAGGYGTSGESLPEEEFIEFLVSGSESETPDPGRPAGWELRIAGGSDPETALQTIYFPAPERAGYFALQRGTSICFASPAITTGLIARLSRLSLPNGPAVYSLRSVGNTSDPGTADRFTIHAIDYARLELDGRRRSLSRAPAQTEFPALMRPSDGGAAVSPYCGERTAATPGAPASFAPFVYRDPEAPYRLRLYSEIGPLEFQVNVDAHDLNTPEISATFEAVHGQTIVLPELPSTQPDPRPRSLYAAYARGRLLGAGERFASRIALQIQSVAPTPPAGGVEWVRLCSPDGFSPAAFETRPAGDSVTNTFSLYIKDSSSSDRIVAFEKRHPSPTFDFPGPLLGLRTDSLELAPGSCALLVDPDYDGQPLPLTSADSALWTIAESAAIGNGLSAGEGLRIYLRGDSESRAVPLCSYGRPDLPDPFELSTSRGQLVSRDANFPGSAPFDEAEAFTVVSP